MRKLRTFWPIFILIGAACFGLGWIANGMFAPSAPPSKALRLNGYQFIDPLLVCNVSNPNPSQEDTSLSTAVASIINDQEQASNISKASVYFTDFANGKWMNVNRDETYYPSSLGKIPIAMAYYELAENSNSVLGQEITYSGGPDLNDSQDIKPAKAIIPGKTYTVEQLIQYMIVDSDNNAAQLLYNNIDKNTLQNIYGDLGIPVNDDATIANLDFITPQQIGLLFRVLYNATYLSRDDSEKLLELMSESSFTQGIVAGLPSSTIVAHKLGLVGIQTNGVTTEHELHDCGIVYANDPYLVCVMTRGSSPLSTMESIIANISKVTHQNVENGN